MSKETRTIRPFVGLDGLANVLDEILLHFGPEACLANSGITVDLAPHEFVLRPASIEWAADDQAFRGLKRRLRDGAEAAALSESNLALVVVASSSFLKLADVVFSHALDKLDELERVTILTHGDRATAFSAPFSGFTVDAFLVLRESLEPKPLRPYLQGTWLARSSFRVGTVQGPALLPPTPMTQEVRSQRGLPARAIRYIYFGDHDLLEPYSGQEHPVFYVDEDLLALMNARRTSPASKALQLQLAHDFVSTVVRRAASEPRLETVAYDDVRASLLGSVIRIAAGTGSKEEDHDRILSLLRSDPDSVIARAEHFIDLASGYGSILKEGDA